jgi:hypothetical protein
LRTSASISSRKSGFPSAAAGDPLCQLRLDAAEPFEELRRLPGVERLEQHGRRVPHPTAPGGPQLEQLRSRHAEQEDRRVARQLGRGLDEREEGRLRPVQVVEHTDQRRFLRLLFEHLPESPRDLLGRRGFRRLAEQRPERRGGGRALRERCQLRPRTTRASEPARNSAASRDFPTPAEPSTVNSWHDRSCTARESASWSERSSRSRPTIGAAKRRSGSLVTASSR